MTVHGVEKGKILSFILDYIEYVTVIWFFIDTNVRCCHRRLNKHHTGYYLANKLKACLQSFGIDRKVCTLMFLVVCTALIMSLLPRSCLSSPTMPQTTTCSLHVWAKPSVGSTVSTHRFAVSLTS